MTVNPPAFIDSEEFRVQRTVIIRALPGRVWETITDPTLVSEWFGETASFYSLEPGSLGTLGFGVEGEFPIRIEAVDEPHLFAFRWGRPEEPIEPQNSTLVTFTLDELAEGTRLTVVESGFDVLDSDPLTAMDGNREGWDGELDELVALLELQDSQ